MSLRIDRSLAGSLASRAEGRVIVVDAFRSWQCGTWVGDLRARWRPSAPGDRFVTAPPAEGVPVYVRADLAHLLDKGGASLHGSGVIRRNGLRVELDRPELWISWLDHPGAWAARPTGEAGAEPLPEP